MAVKKKKRPTLKSIAYMTGLGVTTVSKALKDAPDIKDSTKERVRMVAEKVGYQPDRAGLRLRTGKTNVISLSINAHEEIAGMTSQFLVGAMNALEHTQYNLIFSPYVSAKDALDVVRQIVETRAADGIVLSDIEPGDPRLAYLAAAGVPYVTHGRSNMGLDHAFFDFDSERFGKNAVELLAQSGCKRLGLIAGPVSHTYGRFMRDGFASAVKENGVEVYPLPMIALHDSIEKISADVFSIFENSSENLRPDAFVCGSVSSTIGVIGGIERAGLVVGKDVHIVAKQPATSLLKWFGRPVHVIVDDFKGAGYGLVSSLINIIEGEPVAEHQTVVYPDEWGQLSTE